MIVKKHHVRHALIVRNVIKKVVRNTVSYNFYYMITFDKNLIFS